MYQWLVSFRAIAAGVLLCGLTAIAPAGTPPAHPITNIDTWARLVRMPAKRPLDVVIIAGDSTIAVLGGGQGRALFEVLGERYQPFATAFTSPGINNGANIQLNMGWQFGDPDLDAQTGAPAPFDAIFQRTESDPLVFDGHFTRYGYISRTLSPTSYYTAELSAASRLNLRGAIRFQVWYAAGPEAGGSFCPQIYSGPDSFGAAVSLSQGLITAPVSSAEPADHVASFSAVLPANPARNGGRSIYWDIAGNTELGLGAIGPMTFYGVRACAEDARSGYALSILDAIGGESDYGLAVRARDWLERGAGPAGRSPSYETFIGALRDRQIAMGFKPQILLIIQGMGNSSGESGRSINDVADNNTPAGVQDNVTDIYNRYEKFRARAGYGADEFTYAIVGFTVINPTDPREDFYDACRKRMAKWSATKRNVCNIDWSGFMTPAETHLWATWGFDEIHLILTGYKEIWRRAINHGLNYPINLKVAGD